MKFKSPQAFVYVPGGGDVSKALEAATHLAIGAHADDIEIMAYHGVLAGLAKHSFVGVIACDGAGSVRSGPYANMTNDEIIGIRQKEQRNAADIGKYKALVMLNHTSAVAKDVKNKIVIDELYETLSCTKLDTVYLHNLADKHETHVAVALKSLLAIRKLPKSRRPKKVYGCEVWRNLDWLSDKSKVVLPVSQNEELALKLCQAHESQVYGGKRYDIGAIGRRKANATFFESTATDTETALSFAMDLTPLIHAKVFDPKSFVKAHIRNFEKETLRLIKTVKSKK